MRLIQKITYLLTLFSIAVLSIHSSFGQDTYADNFNGGGNYSNSSGNQTWTPGWVENFDGGSPNGGRIEINGNQLEFNNLDGRSISRLLDLSAATAVTLTLDFDATSRGNESLLVQLRNSAGAWVTIATINTTNTGTITHTLTADQISANSGIQFVGGDNAWNGAETILIDNVLFTTDSSTFVITDGVTVNTCTGTFVDSGGSGGNYSNNEDITYTICPDVAGSNVNITFTQFNVEDDFDFLRIYDGTSTASPLIGIFDNGNSPNGTTISSTTGCLTFRFTADFIFNFSGWEATISCTASAADLSIGDAVVNENAGTIDFTVTHSGASTTGPFTVEYTTADNTATAPGDYTATGAPTPTITFSGTTGETQTISIPIIDDNFTENTETFFVDIANPSDGTVTISDSQGEGTINDDDIASIAIGNVTVNEGGGTATLDVVLSGANVSGGFTVEYSTADGSATAPADYTATGAPTPTISFTGTGSLPETQQITIPIIDDSDVEGNHNFFVNLGAVSNALVTISDNQGEVTIQDNDAGISIADLTNIGEASGTANFVITHTGADVPGGFTVNFATADNTAIAPGDYTATASPPAISFSGTSGETQTISVTIINDGDTEGNESFFVNLTGVSSPQVTITDSQAEGTIIDDEIPFVITDGVTDNTCSGFFVDTGGFNGNYSNNEAITYTLCPDTPGSVIVLDFEEFNVEDFFDGLAIFEGTTTTTQIGVFDNENVPRQIVSTDPSGCLTFVFTSDFTVVDDGWVARISCASVFLNVSNVTVSEDAGTATFTVTLNGNVPGGFTVDYLTEDGTAFADSDYTTTSGTLSFTGVNNEQRTVTVPIIDNTFAENDEIFYLTLNNVSNSTVGLIEGIGTITDDAGDTPVDDDVPLTLFDEFNGYFDYALTGGSLRLASDSVDPCGIAASSSNTLTTVIPPGSTIEQAYLIWGHTSPSADDVVVFEGQNVTASVINSANGGTTYGMVGDVTSIIQGIADPSTNVYDFSGLSVDNRTLCDNTIIIGGWSLMIFYTNPAFPAVGINMYNGFDASSNNTTTYTLDGFYAIGAAGSKTSVLSWEGDGDITGNEEISLTVGVNNTTLNGDGDNTGGNQNVFNSTIFDNTVTPNVNTNTEFAIDLDTYDVSALIGPGETSATTQVTTGGDFIILNTVLLKVPSNLITGFVFEDVNYPGGVGRNFATSSGVGIENARVELYRETSPGTFTFEEATTSDNTGEYTFGGIPDGTYRVRVVNNTVRSTRGGGAACTTCLPVQTFRRDYASGGTFTDQPNEVGGVDPTATDAASNTLTGAQTVSSVTINGEGVVDLDFGFNFNTIVNTNADGQGSLEQFIVNANNLDETGLNIEANGIFNPAAGVDTSIFMIPTNTDTLGRTTDPNYDVANGFFDINTTSNQLTEITSDNTSIDGRTQTAYSGDTNSGTIGAGGTTVGVSATTLPNYNLPEIQVRSDSGDILQMAASNTIIRNIAVYGGNLRAVRQNSGTNNLISSSLLGVNALGVLGTVGVGSYVDDGVQVTGGEIIIDSNYIASNTDFGVVVNGGTSTTIQNNHFTGNGYRACEYNITIQSGSGVVIQNNLIENAESTGINDAAGGITITENTVTTSGTNNGCAQLSGIELSQNNSSVSNNVVSSNAGAGIVLSGGNTSGNRISQNSIFANGTAAPALGIDINNDGVTLNDNGDADNGPNTSINFPIIESASISGTTIRIRGWVGAGATVEFFLTDINQGTAAAGDNQLGLSVDYGEGQVFVTSATEGSGTDSDATTSGYTDADGNTDNTNRFDFLITLASPIAPGSLISATATISNSTSEFGGSAVIGSARVITNRTITYRVRQN